MKKTRMLACAAVLALTPLLAAGADTLQLDMVEIRDPMLDNAVAARVALPKGWRVKVRDVTWNVNLFGDPVRVVFGLEGPEDEVEFAAVSRMKFNFDQGWVVMADHMYNETIRMANEQCQTSWRFTPNYAQMMCAQISAALQPELERLRQYKENLLAGKIAENGTMARPATPAADVARWLLGQDPEMTNVRVKRIERPGDLGAMLRKAVGEQDAEMRRISAQLNQPFIGVTFDVARVYFSFDKGGKQYDGVSLILCQYCSFATSQRLVTLAPMPGPDPMAGKEFTMWSVHINGATALAGRLDAHEAELTAIVANSSIDPLWQAAVDRFADEMTRRITEARLKGQLEQFQRDMAHQKKMQDMRNDTFNYVSQRRQEVFARRSESLSNAAAGWTDALTDRQRWQGVGDKYVAPNDYKYAWEGPDGKTAFSNDSSFNPNHSSDFSGDWQAMRKVPW